MPDETVLIYFSLLGRKNVGIFRLFPCSSNEGFGYKTEEL